VPAGRPTDYQESYAGQAEKLCKLGATDIELADFFEVDVRTIYRWKHSIPEFCQALKVGKDALDDRVERSLYNRAVGYSFASEKLFSYQGVVTRADVIEHVPPDPGAAMSWLKNRRGDVWREKSEVDVTVKDMAEVIAARRQQVAQGRGDEG
jgi:phage terminase Nu1 subunit (DNA packaging protein)